MCYGLRIPSCMNNPEEWRREGGQGAGTGRRRFGHIQQDVCKHKRLFTDCIPGYWAY